MTKFQKLFLGTIALVGVAVLALGAWWLLRPISIERHSVIFVIGARSNSRTIAFGSDEVDQIIRRVAESYGFAGIVVADGTPGNRREIQITEEGGREIGTGSEFNFSQFYPGTVRGRAAYRLGDGDSGRQQFERNLRMAMRNAQAETEQADVLGAIIEAERLLRDRTRAIGGTLEIVVLGTGLSTTGQLNFADANNWLYSDPTEMINGLRRNANLPDLQGVTVTWLHMFDVYGEQDELPPLPRSNLEEIWRLIMRESGVNEGDFNLSLTPPDPRGYEGLPYVSPVEILPIVSRVRIEPPHANIQRGTGFDFRSIVTDWGGNLVEPENQEVTFDIIEDKETLHPGTKIHPETGNLIVAPDDPRPQLTIRIRSVVVPEIYDTATVILTNAPPPPNPPDRVVISPDIAFGEPGRSLRFTPEVFGVVDGMPISQGIIVEIDGNTDPNTRFANGIFIIGTNETGSVLLLIIRSALDESIYGVATVVVIPPPEIVEVNFDISGRATPINEREARRDIERWVNFVNSGGEIFIFGRTARGNENLADLVDLSQRRANAVRDLFIESGASPNNIITKGLAFDNPWHEDNGVPRYNWNEATARRNRRVVIMSQDDPLAQAIYKGEWQQWR